MDFYSAYRVVDSYTTLILLCDNQSDVAIVHNLVFHNHTKHMEIDVFFFLKESYAQVALYISYSYS